MRLRHISLFALCAFVPLAYAAAPTVMGDWKTPAGSVVRVEPCGSAVCLRVVQVVADAPVATDVHNPDAGLRTRKICGLLIGTAFHPDNPAHLSGGQLYDPKSGHTYHGTIAFDGEKLKLRGYIGISLFGRSETWTRTGAPPVCK